MSDNKKYYYLKLKDNFFDSDEMIILESMQDGYMYSNILLKLYLRSLKYNGRLMFNERIPFNSNMLSTVTRHSVGVVEKAMSVFQDLGIIDVLDNGAIYMSDIQNFIGESSTEADRKRLQRSRMENEQMLITGQMSGQMSDKNPPEIEIEKDIELELDIEPKEYKIVADYYKENLSNFSQIQKLTDKRKSQINARIKDYGLDRVLVALKTVSESKFLNESICTNWLTFDWIFNPNNFVKIIEGKYNEKVIGFKTANEKRNDKTLAKEKKYSDEELEEMLLNKEDK